jgi:hypothetical protein
MYRKTAIHFPVVKHINLEQAQKRTENNTAVVLNIDIGHKKSPLIKWQHLSVAQV